jgi:hypothetical protein
MNPIPFFSNQDMSTIDTGCEKESDLRAWNCSDLGSNPSNELDVVPEVLPEFVFDSLFPD